MPRFLILFFALSGLVLSNHAWTKTLYISDKIYVPVRAGQGNEYGILHKGLPTGTAVTLLEENDSWTKITTAQGITGWIRKQYLGETPPASSQLKVASRKIAELEETLESLQDRHSILQSDYEATKGQLETTEEELNNIRSISATHIESYERLQSLTKEIQLLQTENDILKAENASLKLDERTTFFIYGASTLLLGILLAVILPRLRRRRRNNNWAN